MKMHKIVNFTQGNSKFCVSQRVYNLIVDLVLYIPNYLLCQKERMALLLLRKQWKKWS